MPSHCTDSYCLLRYIEVVRNWIWLESDTVVDRWNLFYSWLFVTRNMGGKHSMWVNGTMTTMSYIQFSLFKTGLIHLITNTEWADTTETAGMQQIKFQAWKSLSHMCYCGLCSQCKFSSHEFSMEMIQCCGSGSLWRLLRSNCHCKDCRGRKTRLQSEKVFCTEAELLF